MTGLLRFIRCALSFFIFWSGVFLAVDADGDAPTQSKDYVEMNPYQVNAPSLFFGYTLYMRTEKRTHLIHDITFTQIEKESLAEKAGLKKGDLLLKVDENEIVGMAPKDFEQKMQRNVNHGDKVSWKFTIKRGRQTKIIELTATG